MHQFQISASDCFYYFVYGTCGFGMYCRFNHLHQANAHPANRRSSFPCRAFLAGFCKYGAKCRFFHPVLIDQLNPWLHFNTIGLPKRWGESNCTHFMRTGECGYGLACKFNHPEPDFYYPYQGYGPYVGGQAIGYPIGFSGVNYGWTQRPVVIREPNVTLNDVGLPVRPGKSLCNLYKKLGHCNYGRGCKFDHPVAPSSNKEISSTSTSTSTTTTVE